VTGGDQERLKADPEPAIVRKIFEEYAGGKGIEAIARDLSK
jgi:hypothetical protein